VPLRPPIVLFLALVVLAGACAKGESAGDSSAPTATITTPPTAAPATTSPFEVVVTEDTVRVSTAAITTSDGATLLAFTASERACVEATAGTVADLAAGGQVSPAPVDDPDAEQTLAEIVVSCLPFDRFQGVVADQLATQSALAGVDRACLDQEVRSLQDTPDVLASVLRGDPDALSVVAGTAATNCR
jgi:hypothetical protein